MLVKRWRRFGKDRLYVTREEVLVGWWDLMADRGHPESPADEATLVAAVVKWRGEQDQQQGLALPAATGEASEPDILGVPSGSQPHESAPVPVRASESSTVAVTTTSAPASAQRDAEPARPWLDLSTNQPGAEARERAEAAWSAAPVKSTLARVLRVHTSERAWRIGADGEERVGARLAKLSRKDPRWRSLHAIPVGSRGSDIDHLAIGPGGVFTVNAKHHPGAKIWVGGNTFLVDGHKQPYIRNSRHEAARAAKLLTSACGFPVHVEGIIATVNADDVVVKGAPAGVHVVPRMQLVRWLSRHGDIYDEEIIDAIHDAARRSTTWHP